MNIIFVLTSFYTSKALALITDSEISQNSNEENLQQHKIFTKAQGKFHGQIMTSAFFCVIQFSVILQRYMKQWKYSSFFHGLIGLGCLILVQYSAFTFYQEFYVNDTEFITKTRHHVRLGFTICALITSQVYLGLLTKFLILYGRSLYLLLIARKVHHMLGWTILISGLINLKLGWNIRNEDTVLSIIYPCYAVLVATYAALEIFHRTRSYKIEVQPIRSGNSSILTNEFIRSELNYSDIIKKITKRDKKWVFFNQYILDVSSFVTSHPGGSFMINGIIGEDASKYVYGIVNYAKAIPAHIHSSQAKILSKKFAFAKIDLASDIILTKLEDASTPHIWKVVNNFKLTEEIHCIELLSDSAYLNPNPYGYDWMGLHFSIKHPSLKLTRFYSLVHVNFSKWSREIKTSGVSVHLSDYQMSTSDAEDDEEPIRLYVKNYEIGRMSSYLCQLSIGRELRMKGPYGPGLAISKVPKGPCLAFGAGTGVLVYLDLVSYIWRQKVNSEFILYLYISFKSRKEAIGIDLLEATQKKFKHQLRLQVNLDEEKIGVRLNKTNLSLWITHELKKVWICGPAGFNRFIEENLIDYGIDKKSIIIL